MTHWDNTRRGLQQTCSNLPRLSTITVSGRLTRLRGMLLEAEGCQINTGQRCLVRNRNGQQVEAEVVGFDRQRFFLMPMEYGEGLGPGDAVLPLSGDTGIPVGKALLGRVLDGMARPLDGKGGLLCDKRIPLHGSPINPLQRRLITQPLDVGVRVLNGLMTAGRGQRLGILAATGVGKSVLLGMMTRNTEADVVVVVLVGERGREVREFIEHTLGAAGMVKAVVVASPADDSPVMRLRASLLGHRIAEHFRDEGCHVLLLMDSLTRYAQAQREIALAVGEPPSSRGYPPSVFSLLPRLVERAGNGCSDTGSITAFYTVLVEGDRQEDPVADAACAILDGHIHLTRQRAAAGYYPAVDIGPSISRAMERVVSSAHQTSAIAFRRTWERCHEIRELMELGAYTQGSDPVMDQVLTLEPRLNHFICQGLTESVSLADTIQALARIAEECAHAGKDSDPLAQNPADPTAAAHGADAASG